MTQRSPTAWHLRLWHSNCQEKKHHRKGQEEERVTRYKWGQAKTDAASEKCPFIFFGSQLGTILISEDISNFKMLFIAGPLYLIKLPFQ